MSNTYRRNLGVTKAGLVAVCGLLAGASGAAAQPAGQPTGAELEKTPGEPVRSGERLAEHQTITFEFKGWSEYDFNAGIDNSSADVSIFRLGGQLGVSGPIGGSWRWNLEGLVEGSWYNFDDAAGLVPGTSDPLNEVVRIGLTPSVLYQYSDKLAFLGGAIVDFSGEPGADVGDSATFGGFFGTRWALSERFSLQLGFALKTRLEDNIGFVPSIGFDWRINDRVRLATEGLGLRLTAEIEKHWSAFMNGGYSLREYRLEDHAGSAISEGVFRDQRFTIGGGVEWRPTGGRDASVFLTGGVVAWSELRFDDSEGIKVTEEDADPTGYVGISGTIRF